MARSIKLEEENYWDSSNIVYNQEPISNILKYSTKEQIVGTWIDGRTIYRKVIKIAQSQLVSGGQAEITHGIDNFENIIKAYGFIERTSGIRNVVPWYAGSNYYFVFNDFNTTFFRVAVSGELYSFINNFYAILEYVKSE